MKYSIVLALLFVLTSPLFASSNKYHSKYAGQQNRKIKSLSPADINELEKGRGWGLAKAAELNGMPGPIHILEMKKAIKLTKAQQKSIERIYSLMNNQAIKYGKQLIAEERKLNEAFLSKKIDKIKLKKMLQKIANTRMELRYVHLYSHLEAARVLSDTQINVYNKLRGYFSKEPCKNIPEGHKPDVWKKHNNCI